MPRYVVHIPTKLGPDQAFSDLSHFDRAAEWDPSVGEGTMLTPEPVRRGSRFALQAEFLGRSIPMEYEIVEFEPGTRVVLRADTPFVRSIDTMTFATASGASGSNETIVTYDARLEAKGWAKLATPLLALAFRRIGDRAAAGLHQRLGAESPV